MTCRCASEAQVRPLHAAEAYNRITYVLHWGPKRFQHPRFVGRSEVTKRATNGGVSIVTHRGEDVAASVVNTRLSILNTLHVVGAHRGHGLGAALLAHLDPCWVRAIDGSQDWFAARGYHPVGVDDAGRRRVHIMVAVGVADLAGSLGDVLGDPCGCDRQADLAAPR
jgi:GNAT superfamily N-acetyltransferase